MSNDIIQHNAPAPDNLRTYSMIVYGLYAASLVVGIADTTFVPFGNETFVRFATKSPYRVAYSACPFCPLFESLQGALKN